ncbi:MAG: ribonuclease HIII [Victivallales bacterium]|nr:ribonuclease HIII [Victivallales bacterium]
MPSPNIYVHTLTELQIATLRNLLQERGWEFSNQAYAHWAASKDKVKVVAYESGKLTAQGKGFGEFVQFLLEPEILHEATFGYETELAKINDPQEFLPHCGIDESGKGDFFGPLVVACCYTDETTATTLREAGVADSKTIANDAAIARLAGVITKVTQGRFALVVIGMEAYNRLYGQFHNLNRLLGWGHAKALEKLLEKVPDCPRAISDQFGNPYNVQRALQERGRKVILEQHPKAEADIAVAAASILARHEFVRRLKALETSFGVPLPKGAGPGVKAAASKFLERYGRQRLGEVAKLHFKTASEI